MHDEVRVRMSHGRDHGKKELDARFNRKLVPIAIAVDVVAFDEFEDDGGCRSTIILRRSVLRYSGARVFQEWCLLV